MPRDCRLLRREDTKVRCSLCIHLNLDLAFVLAVISSYFPPDPEWETPFSFFSCCQDDGFTNLRGEGREGRGKREGSHDTHTCTTIYLSQRASFKLALSQPETQPLISPNDKVRVYIAERSSLPEEGASCDLSQKCNERRHDKSFSFVVAILFFAD